MLFWEPIREGSLAVSLGTNSLGATSLRVLANTSAFEQSLKRSIKRIGLATTALFAGLGAASFFGGAVKDAVDLQKQIKEIQTLLDKTNTNPGFDANKMFGAASIRDVSNQIGISADKVASSLYLILSSGIPAADAIDTLTAASKGAIAVGADLVNTVDFTTSAVNAYGNITDKVTGQVYNASRANDILFKALQYGKGTLNDFSKYISTAIPIASQLGVSLEDLAASAAANTLTGQSARKVFTGLKVAMQGLSDTTKGTGKAFLDITGKTFPQFIKEGGKLSDAAKILADNVKGGAGELTNLGGAKEGITALQTLVLQYDKMPGIVKGTNDSIGAASKAADIVNQSISRQIDFIKTRFKNFRGSVGDWLVPVITSALVALDKFRPKWDAFWSSLWNGIQSGLAVVGPLFQNAFDLIKQAITSVDWKAYGDVLKAIFEGAAFAVAPFVIAIGAILTIVGQIMLAFGPWVGLLSQMKPLVAGIAAGVVTWFAAQTLLNFSLQESVIWTKAVALWQGIVTAGEVIQIAVTQGLAEGWIALSAAMTANPIGLVIALIAALVVGIIYAWNTSEKFRDVVKDVWNAILAATQMGVTVFIKLMTAWALAPIYGIDLILKALAHLPKHFGGGAAAGAEAAVSALIGQVNKWRDSTISAINDVIQAAKALPSQLSLYGSSDAADVHGFGGTAASITAELNRQNIGVPKPAIPAIPVPTGGGGGGGNYDPTGADKNTAKAAAKTHAALLKTLKKDTAKFGDVTAKTTVDKITSMIAKVKADYTALGQKVPAALKKIEDSLLKNAKAQDLNSESLKTAKADLKTLTDAADQYRATLKASTTLDITSSSSTEGIQFRMGQMLERTKAFIANIKKLKAEGLSPTLLKQLIDAGPLAGAAAAQALAGASLADIGNITNTQNQLEGLGDQLGQIGVSSFLQTGIDMAQGIVTGLQSQDSVLVKAVESLGNKLSKAFAKSIGAHSPSRVFFGHAGNIIDGIVGGLDANSHKAVAAMDGVGNSLGLNQASVAGSNGIAPAAGGPPSIHVYIGDTELTGMISVIMNSSNRNTKSRASARSRSGVVAGSRGM